MTQVHTTKDAYTGTWSDAASWEVGGVPNESDNNLEITINGTITSSASLSFSNNFKTLTVNDTLIVEGDLTFTNGASPGITIGSEGLLIVTGNFNYGASQENGTITIDSGGRLVVYQNTTVRGDLAVAGAWNTSGSFSHSGGRSLNLSGSLVVGKDMSLSAADAEFQLGSYIGVLGNADFSSSNFNTDNGEVDVMGTASGTQQPATITTSIEAGDPILYVTEGMDVLLFNSTADMAGVPYTNNLGSPFTGTIWESGDVETDCHVGVQISADVTFSGGASYAEAYLQYSTDGGNTWSAAVSFTNYSGDMYRAEGIMANGGIVAVRLYADNFPDGETVTLDNVTIAATNEGGIAPNVIQWGAIESEVCVTGDASYTIANAADYATITWSIEGGGGSIIGVNDEASCTVRWTSLPGTLRATVTGGSCGGESAEIYREITVEAPSALSFGVEINNNTCNGVDDGAIAVTICGGSGTYTYAWSGPNSFTSDQPSISALVPGTYSLSIKDEADVTVFTDNYVLTNPQPLSLTYEMVKCIGDDGSITAHVSGGTPPYNITLSGPVNEGPVSASDYTFENLLAGTYTINVDDVNSCPFTPVEVILEDDEDAPVCADLPGDATFLYENFKDFIYTQNPIDLTQQQYQPAVPEDDYHDYLENTLADEYSREYLFDVSNHNNLSLTFNLTQNTPDGQTWDDEDDYFVVSINYDGVEEEIYRLPDPENGWGSELDDEEVSVSLPLIAQGANELRVYLSYTTDGTEDFTIENVVLSGSTVGSMITTDPYDPENPNSRGAGEPENCTDNQTSEGTIVVTYEDGPVNWVCNEAENQEFWFNRTFTITDACGNLSTHVQKIGIGSKPFINAAVNQIFDFCHNSNVALDIPEANDGGCTADPSIEWEVTVNGDNVVPASGTTVASGGAITITTFPQPVLNDTTYTITWTVRDEAGLSMSVTQDIKILRPLTINFDPVKDHFCSKEEVQFNLTVSGGTGVYEVPVITPEEIDPLGWNDPDQVGDGIGTYTTDGLELSGTESVVVTFTDTEQVIESITVPGGCPKTWTFTHGTDVDAPFTIHQNISTNEITRD